MGSARAQGKAARQAVSGPQVASGVEQDPDQEWEQLGACQWRSQAFVQGSSRAGASTSIGCVLHRSWPRPASSPPAARPSSRVPMHSPHKLPNLHAAQKCLVAPAHVQEETVMAIRLIKRLQEGMVPAGSSSSRQRRQRQQPGLRRRQCSLPACAHHRALQHHRVIWWGRLVVQWLLRQVIQPKGVLGAQGARRPKHRSRLHL